MSRTKFIQQKKVIKFRSCTILIQNFSINVHERVDIFTTNIEKNNTNRQEQLDTFCCGDNSDRIIAVIDLIFLQVVL